MEAEGEAIFLRAGALRPFEISTQPFPGFPTDLQAQFMALACVADKVQGTYHFSDRISRVCF